MLNLCVRERELVKLLAQGLTPNEISRKMQLSSRTIEFLVAEIDQKAQNSGSNLLALVEMFA